MTEQLILFLYNDAKLIIVHLPDLLQRSTLQLNCGRELGVLAKEQ